RSAPFFIIGNPRSGTSLLRSLFNTHPNVLIPPECGFLLWLHGAWFDRTWSESVIKDFALAVHATRKFETWNIDLWQLEEGLVHGAPSSYAEACAIIYARYAQSRNKEITCWCDKNNHYINRVGQ